ncbi:hypothetical protein IWQ62_000150 [Dispira parvispora]|uniref:Protein phosphatase 1 regulatory subunit 21 N-terminal domain-containing protein n=1 Tax=Dispira parvispora TaxID=1520584 RepID=A0A9W8B1X7_9FUNG|nr:hypothetical protein IWQ62_000150 [Dispira parvispora]
MAQSNNDSIQDLTIHSSTHSGLPSSDTAPIDSIAHKYQKLINEYSRIKAQNTVLKQAIVHSQKKVEQITHTLETQRKTCQELEHDRESLVFNNRRLTKRLDMIQQGEGSRSYETEDKRKGSLSPSSRPASVVFPLTNDSPQRSGESSGSGWLSMVTRSGTSPLLGRRESLRDKSQQLSSTREALEAISAELQAKITENETLYNQLEENRSTHQAELSKLQQAVQTLEQDKVKFQAQLQHTEDADRPKLKQYQKRLTELTANLDNLKVSHEQLRTLLACTRRDWQYARSRLVFTQAFTGHFIQVASQSVRQVNQFNARVTDFSTMVRKHCLETIQTLKQAWDTLRQQLARSTTHIQPELTHKHELLMQECVELLCRSMYTLPISYRPTLLEVFSKYFQWYFNLLVEAPATTTSTTTTTEFYRETFKQLLACAARIPQLTETCTPATTALVNSPALSQSSVGSSAELPNYHPDYAPLFALESLRRIIADKVIEVHTSPLRYISAFLDGLYYVCLWKLAPWTDNTTESHVEQDKMDIFELNTWPVEITALQSLYTVWSTNYFQLRTLYQTTVDRVTQLESDKQKLEQRYRDLTKKYDEEKAQGQTSERRNKHREDKLTHTIQALSKEIEAKSQEMAGLKSEKARQRDEIKDLRLSFELHFDQFEQERKTLSESQEVLRKELEMKRKQCEALEMSTQDRINQAVASQQRQHMAKQEELEQQNLHERENLMQMITELTQQVATLHETAASNTTATPATTNKSVHHQATDTIGLWVDGRSATDSGSPQHTVHTSDTTDNLEEHTSPPSADGNSHGPTGDSDTLTSPSLVTSPRSLSDSSEQGKTEPQVSPQDPTGTGDSPTEESNQEPQQPVDENVSQNNIETPELKLLSPKMGPTNGHAEPEAQGLSDSELAQEFLKREKAIVAYYQEIIAKLQVTLEITDSKAVQCHQAWQLTSQQLEERIKQHTNLEQQTGKLHDRIAQLEDELSTTHQGYTQQLQILTESLANRS